MTIIVPQMLHNSAYLSKNDIIFVLTWLRKQIP